MSMQILVPLDGSRFSEQAVAYASGIARRSRGTIHLVRVNVEPVMTAPELVFDQLKTQLWETAQDYVNEQAEQAALRFGVSTQPVLLGGSVVQALSTYVTSAGIDLVVMTTHGRSGLSRMIMGSVADALVHSLAVPIFMVRPTRVDVQPDEEPISGPNIMIPLDGSPQAEQILEPAVELGWHLGARYTLVQVVVPALSETYATAVTSQILNEEFEHERDQALAYLESVASRMRAVGLHVDTAVISHGQTATGILREAGLHEANLIAMTTHGRSGWKRIALGSVASTVLHNTSVPLMLLRSSEPAAWETEAPSAASTSE